MVQTLKVCVIGASGFIGVNLCIALTKAGHSVTAVARAGSSCGYMKNVFSLTSSHVKTIVLENFDEMSFVKLSQSKHQFDMVINATGYAVQRGQENEIIAEQINSKFPVQLLAAFDGKTDRFLHLGSSYEYGDIHGEINETCSTNPDTLYGKTKLKGTKALFEYELKSTKLLCLRLFGVFGPYETQTKLFPLLFSAYFEKKRAEFSNGLQKVDYIHIENVCDAICFLINTGFKENRKLYNVGSGCAYSIREIADVFRRISGNNHKLHWGGANMRQCASNIQFANVDKIYAETGWRPTMSLEEGIRSFVMSHRCTQMRRPTNS